MSFAVDAVYRWPVKGLNAEAHESIRLEPDIGVVGDRRLAIARRRPPGVGWRPGGEKESSEGVDGDWAPPDRFVALKRSARLAMLRAALDADGHVLTLARGGRQVARGDTRTATGRMVIDQFLSPFLGDEAPGGARLVRATAGNLTDVPEPWVSLVSLDSLDDLARVTRAPVDPLRFRANLYFRGLKPWHERDWPGRGFRVGGAVIRVVEPVERCAATEVNPDTAERDMQVLRALSHGFRHTECGVYAEVIQAGEVRAGDRIEPAG